MTKSRKLNKSRVAVLIATIVSFILMVTFGYQLVTSDILAFVNASNEVLMNQVCFFGSMVSFVLTAGELFTKQISKMMEV